MKIKFKSNYKYEMGVGASNLSTSDLSVYQSAISKISQDLVNSTSNASSISLQSKQKITFLNGGFNAQAFGCNSKDKENYINLCQHGTTSGCDYFLQIGAITHDEWVKCKIDCTEQANIIYPKCTPEVILAGTPTINCNIKISQVSNQDATTVQAADSKLDASMSTDISNSFESEIDKQISQTNKDLNFMQFNSSDERTALSQSIKNDISNSISNSSKNLSSTYQNSEQEITFTNTGIINCSGCGSQPIKTSDGLVAETTLPTKEDTNGNCLLDISQSNIQTAAVNQKANAALSSVFNNAVLNELASDYKLAVTQKNAGVNLLDLLMPFIIILVFVLIMAMIGAYTAKGILTSEFIKPIGWAFAILIVIVGIIVLGLALGCEIVPGWPSHCTNAPDDDASATPAKNENDACPDGFKCVYDSYMSCATSSFPDNCQLTAVGDNDETIFCGRC